MAGDPERIEPLSLEASIVEGLTRRAETVLGAYDPPPRPNPDGLQTRQVLSPVYGGTKLTEITGPGDTKRFTITTAVMEADPFDTGITDTSWDEGSDEIDFRRIMETAGEETTVIDSPDEMYSIRELLRDRFRLPEQQPSPEPVNRVLSWGRALLDKAGLQITR